MTSTGTSALASKLSVFPRIGLASLPTPLEPMRRLTAHLGGPRLWVKREDATGLGFGGNKLRKLDYVLHDAVASKADVLVSGGVVQSDSLRQVAAAAAKLGMECHLAVLIGARFDESDVEVVAGHAGPAYGVPHAATIEAIKLAGAHL
jgi:L-cysteate sulfo-lyase